MARGREAAVRGAPAARGQWSSRAATAAMDAPSVASTLEAACRLPNAAVSRVCSTADGDGEPPSALARPNSRSPSAALRRRQKLLEPPRRGPLSQNRPAGPEPPKTSSWPIRSPRRSKLAPKCLRRDVRPSHLDLQRADLVLGDQPPQALEVQRRNIQHVERREERRRDHLLAGQIIDTLGDPAEPVFQGESIEQAGAKQDGSGSKIKVPSGVTGSPLAGRSVAVGPGDVLGQPGRPAAARDELAEPDRRLLALAAEADQLDLVFRAGEMLREVAGRAELDRPGGDSLR